MVVGDKLSNGSILLAQKEERDSVVVLSLVNGKEFATWFLDEKQNPYSGHYFESLLYAVEDFKTRFKALYSGI